MAIITVLLISGVILAFVLGGLNLAAQHLFQVSALHNRHRALCAAEVGISKAQYQLEQNPAYAGPTGGALQDGSKYTVTIVHSGTKATLHSVGQTAGQTQKLRVTLALDADTYLGLSSRGLLDFRTNGYINGIRALSDNRSARGNTYTQDHLQISPGKRLSVTGQASAGLGINQPLQVDGHIATGGVTANPSFTKSSLLATSFPGSVLSSGTVTQNTRVTAAETNLTGALHIPAGVTVHVEGDLILNHGVSGEGTLVVDGNLLMRGSENLRNDNPKGLLVYADKDIILAHPSAYTDSGEPNGFTAQVSPVGDLFADMPDGVPYLLRQRLPPGAPSNVNFFARYASQESSPTASFTEWKNGDGTTLNPGLPPNITDWLHRAAQMHGAIEATAGP